MYSIVFDLEWNMAGYHATPRAKTLPFEIIEIGAVKLNHRLEAVDRFSVWVTPVVHTRLSRHVAKVTGRSEASLREGLPFPEAVAAFFSWAAKIPAGSGGTVRPLAGAAPELYLQAETQRFFFATWSDSDTGPLRENLRFHGLPDTLPARCLNVQKLFSHVLEEGTKHQRSLAHALEALGLTDEGGHHQSLQDAEHTADILRALVEEMEKKREGEPELAVTNPLRKLQKIRDLPIMERLWSYTYDPNLTYKGNGKCAQAEAWVDAERILKRPLWTCPDCHKALVMQQPWRPAKMLNNMRSFHARFHCPDHGNIVGQLRFRKASGDHWFGQWSLRLDRPMEL